MCYIREQRFQLLDSCVTEMALYLLTKELTFRFSPCQSIKNTSRNIEIGSFSGFVKSDVESTLKFVDLLQEGTHSLSSPFVEIQLGALVSRAESLISFLIDTSRS